MSKLPPAIGDLTISTNTIIVPSDAVWIEKDSVGVVVHSSPTDGDKDRDFWSTHHITSHRIDEKSIEKNCVCHRSSRWSRWEWYEDVADKVTTTSTSASMASESSESTNTDCTSHTLHRINDKSDDSWDGHRNTVDIHGDIGTALLLLLH